MQLRHDALNVRLFLVPGPTDNGKRLAACGPVDNLQRHEYSPKPKAMRR